MADHDESALKTDGKMNDDHAKLNTSSSVDSDASYPHSEKHEEAKNGVREGDWLCLVCGANVFGRNISCYRCASPKPGTNARHGDWICLNKNCGAHNYASRHNCYRCHVLKGAEKPGDWPCPACHSNNFASRTECFRCRLPRPPGFAAAAFTNVRPGDWLCPNPSCGSNVFANRETCFRCNTPRPPDAEVASAFSDMRTGDWTCMNCLAMCYANRSTCFRCETPRPPQDAASTASTSTLTMSPQRGSENPYGGSIQQYPYAYPVGYNPYSYYNPYYQVMSPGVVYQQYRQQSYGDWICPKCNQSNFARRTECFKCKAPRSDASSADGSLPDSNHPAHDGHPPSSAAELNAQS